jgi:DNA-binding transcriptional LysR family regulator
MNKKRLREHLEKLHTFKAVADLKSVHKASSKLGLTQPAVSRTIKVLEDVLECRLMERESRGVRLTADGQKLYKYAQLIDKAIDDFDNITDPQDNLTKPLRIATYDNIACGIVSGLGKQLLKELPSLSISTGGPNSKTLGELIAGKYDCAFIAQPRILTGLEYKKLFTERYGLFISPELSKKTGLGKQKLLRVEDLKDFQIIAMPDAIAGANKNIDRLLWDIGLKSPLTIDTYEVAKQMTRDSLGIAIMPYSTAWRDVEEKHVQEIFLKDVPHKSFGTHDMTLCWNPKQAHPGISIFGKILEDFFVKVK